MGIGVNQNQGPVQLEQPYNGQIDENAQTSKGELIKAGSLAGDNLRVGHQNGVNSTLNSSQKNLKPVLSKPNQNPDISTHQSVLSSMNQIVNEGGDKKLMMERLQQLASSADKVGGPSAPNKIDVIETDRGFKGTTDGQDFNVDTSKGTVQVVADGKQVKMKFDQNGQLQRASADNKPFTLSDEEVGTMNQFYQLMALFHEMGVEQRQFSRQGRDMANKALVSTIKEQAEEQRSAAASRLTAGLISGTVKVASGAMSMKGSWAGMKANAKAAPGTNPGEMVAQQWSAAGKMVEGLGEAGASVANYDASRKDSKVTDLRATEENTRHLRQTEQEQMQVASDLSTKARDAYAQTFNQYMQTQSNITRNI